MDPFFSILCSPYYRIRQLIELVSSISSNSSRGLERLFCSESFDSNTRADRLVNRLLDEQTSRRTRQSIAQNVAQTIPSKYCPDYSLKVLPQSIAQTAAQIRLDPQHAVSQSDNWTQLRSQGSDCEFQRIPTPNSSSDSDVRILSAEATKK